MSISKTIPYMYGNLNWKDLEELKEEGKLVVLLPIGSTESHGPHCPVATDAIIALETCLRAAQKLHDKGYKAYVLPTLPYGVTENAREFVGTISISPDTVKRLIAELCQQVSKHGINKICIFSGHAEPSHVKAIYDAIDETYDRTGVRPLFIDTLRRKYIERLPQVFQEP
jgi:creatinine amidohydrolase